MKVLVTGGAGGIGKATVKRLLAHGEDVRAIDRAPELNGDEFAGVEYAQCDILDYAAVREQMRGCDAVIHLAALRSPTMAPGPEVFESNVMGTFNVFEAAASEGIKRIAQASSINALGASYNLGDMHIEYLPVDEAHPTHTTDPYSFAKGVLEDMGRYYWRRDGINSTAMRFPWVYPAGYLDGEIFAQRVQHTRPVIDELFAQPKDVQKARLADAHQWMLNFRRQRLQEYGAPESPRPAPDKLTSDDRLRWIYAFDRFNFWAFVDERDAAQSLHKALIADYEGSHPLFIHDHHNWLLYDSQTLADLFFPDIPVNKPLNGSESLISIDRARALIGFEPEYSVIKRIK